jgi:hypothetical protein
MLMQNPTPVKMLANVPECGQNGGQGVSLDPVYNSARYGPLIAVVRQSLNSFLVIAGCLVALASMGAQTPNFDTLQKSAQAGDAKAQFDLAEAYFEGNGIAKDLATGIDWLKKSASQGYAGAEVTLGFLYQNGVQVPKDPHEAAKWYRRAARQSDKDPKHAQKAQSNLGTLAAQGVISVDESDWRAPEPGWDPVQQVKNPEGKGTGARTAEGKTAVGKNDQGKSKSAPFSLAEVETGLTGGITPKRMATLVGQYGVDFSLSASTKQRLASEGADDSLLQTIASSKQ